MLSPRRRADNEADDTSGEDGASHDLRTIAAAAGAGACIAVGPIRIHQDRGPRDGGSGSDCYGSRGSVITVPSASPPELAAGAAGQGIRFGDPGARIKAVAKSIRHEQPV